MLLVSALATLAFMAAPSSASALAPVNLVPPTIGGTAQEGHQLTCSDGTWLNQPTSYAYGWSRNGTALLGQTSSTYTVQPADVGQALTCTVTASNTDGPSLLAATSLPVVPIAAVDTGKPVNLVPPILTGTAQQGHELSCSDGTWLNDPTAYAKRWKRDGAPISGATGASYTVVAEDVGHQVACSVVATNGAGDSAEATSLPVIPIAAVDTGKPVNLVPPIISGTAQQGAQLSCSDGTWLNDPTAYAKRWKRDGAPISGATGASYTVVADDVGHQVTCSVVATNGAGDSAEATSLPVIPIAAVDTGKPVNLVPPIISGTAQQGHELNCSDGIWLNDPTAYAKRWKRDGSPIAGATGASYTVVAEDVGHQVTCSVVATNAAGDSAEATSLPVIPIAAVDTGKPVNLVPPIISGTAQQGSQLSCSDGIWLNDPTTYAKRWKRDGSPIAGATGASYTVVAGDVGHQVTCSVVATNEAGDSAEATSLPVVPIAAVDTGKPVNLVPPIITGTAQQGSQLSCSDGTWLNDPTSYAKRWKRDGVPIAGATSASYTVVADDVGHQVTCSVVATNGAGDSAEATSLPVIPVAPVDTAKPIALVPPMITGLAQQGRELSCSNGTWLNDPTSYAKRWKRDGAAIAGATAATYTVVGADVGRQLTCSVVASNAAGDSAETTSLPVVPIAGLAVNLTKPTIQGSGRVGEGLLCVNGTWQPAADRYDFAWTRDGNAIPNAGAGAYFPTAADEGRQVACTVTAHTAAGQTSASSDSVTIRPAAGAAAPAPAPAGGAPPAAGDRTPPALTSVSLLRRRFAVGRAATALAAARRAPRPKLGTTLRFRLSEPAAVAIFVARVHPGYRQGRRCVRVTAALRRRLARTIRASTPRVRQARLRALLRRRACSVQVRTGSLVRLGRSGANAVPFSGRIGRRALPPGRYVASLVASDAARNASAWRRVSFQIVAARPARRR